MGAVAVEAWRRVWRQERQIEGTRKGEGAWGGNISRGVNQTKE